ncbi:MAG: hypothetical protein P4L82_21255 [Ancalomicrobiaceae bacterium]|nr:hypothetical protein [Ancalomicrobiaceae bacterium]
MISDVLTEQAFDVSLRAGIATAASVAKWSTTSRSDTDAALRVR